MTLQTKENYLPPLACCIPLETASPLAWSPTTEDGPTYDGFDNEIIW